MTLTAADSLVVYLIASHIAVFAAGYVIGRAASPLRQLANHFDKLE